jgi:adenylate cyclase
VKDFTAIGDVVNTAPRLQAVAGPVEIILSQEVYEHVSARYPDAPLSHLALRGKAEEVSARRLLMS